MDFNGRLRRKTEFINHTLQRLLASSQADGRLKEALSYTLDAMCHINKTKTVKLKPRFSIFYPEPSNFQLKFNSFGLDLRLQLC